MLYRQIKHEYFFFFFKRQLNLGIRSPPIEYFNSFQFLFCLDVNHLAFKNQINTACSTSGQKNGRELEMILSLKFNATICLNLIGKPNKLHLWYYT